MTSAQLRSLRRALLRWYDRNRRDLPWRRDCDPYLVWVSEIMLQQTRVAAVLDHYTRFLQRFPTVRSLAAARASSVLALWSGLGYYHRARRMHQAAKAIVRERSGQFPRTADEWSKLPGVGRYTAAAIASIAFDEPVAVVDGNVKRALQRLIGNVTEFAQFSPSDGRTLRQALDRHWGTETQESTWQLAQALLDRKRPGDFNQAMMELGATVCTPRVPQCPVCPLKRFCSYRGTDHPHEQAARNRKELNYALARRNSAVLLVRRALDLSLMAGMWELPPLDPGSVNGDATLLRLRHSITNTDYRVAIFARQPDQLTGLPNARWVTRKQWEQLPLTGLARKVLRRLSAESPGGAGESKCR